MYAECTQTRIMTDGTCGDAQVKGGEMAERLRKHRQARANRAKRGVFGREIELLSFRLGKQKSEPRPQLPTRKTKPEAQIVCSDGAKPT